MTETQTNSPFPYIRDFGQTISATIDFVRSNGKQLITPLLILVAPIATLTGLFASYTFADYFALALERPANVDAGNFLISMLPTFIGLALTALIATLMLVITTTEYCILVHKSGKDSFELKSFCLLCIRKIPSYLLYMIVVSIMSGIGAILCYLPTIYLQVVFSSIYAVKANEGLSLGDSISRCFRIIKGNWWSTFGLQLVVQIALSVIGGIFILPMYILMIVRTYFSVEQLQGAGEVPAYVSILTVFFTIVALVANYILGGVSHIASTFRYFSLAEQKDGSSMFSQIDRIGTTSDSNLPEETY